MEFNQLVSQIIKNFNGINNYHGIHCNEKINSIRIANYPSAFMRTYAVRM